MFIGCSLDNYENPGVLLGIQNDYLHVSPCISCLEVDFKEIYEPSFVVTKFLQIICNIPKLALTAGISQGIKI